MCLWYRWVQRPICFSTCTAKSGVAQKAAATVSNLTLQRIPAVNAFAVTWQLCQATEMHPPRVVPGVAGGVGRPFLRMVVVRPPALPVLEGADSSSLSIPLLTDTPSSPSWDSANIPPTGTRSRSVHFVASHCHHRKHAVIVIVSANMMVSL